MRLRPATPRANDRSIERVVGVTVSRRALLAAVALVCAAAAVVVCLPQRWVGATDATDARQLAAQGADSGPVMRPAPGADARGVELSRALDAELFDPTSQDATPSSALTPLEPTRVVPSTVGLPGDELDESSRAGAGLGGNTFGFDLFTHIGKRAPLRRDDGRYLDHHPDGGVAVEGMYENGEREGPWVSYYADGSLRVDGQYRDGKREGRWKAYHPSGQLMGEGEYSGGLREGAWVLYYSNGLVKEQGVFEHDLRHGPWQYYDGFGQLEARSGFYRYGRML